RARSRHDSTPVQSGSALPGTVNLPFAAPRLGYPRSRAGPRAPDCPDSSTTGPAAYRPSLPLQTSAPEYGWPDPTAVPGWPLHQSEEHTSELQSRENLVCRLLLEKKNTARSKKH